MKRLPLHSFSVSSFLAGGVVGAVFISLFLFKSEEGPQKAPPNPSSQSAKTAQEYKIIGDSRSGATSEKPSETYTSDVLDKSSNGARSVIPPQEGCDYICVLSLKDLILGAGKFSENEEQEIYSHTVEISEILLEESGALDAFKTLIQNATDYRQRSVLVSIAEQFPTDIALDVVDGLETSPQPENRRIGIELMSRISATLMPEGQEKLVRTIYRETDPSVLSSTLQLASSMPPDTLDDAARRTIFDMMEADPSPEVRAAAREVMIYHGKDDAALQSTIISDIRSSDSSAQIRSIENLQLLINARDTQANYYVNPEIISSLDGIANDRTADLTSRILALETLADFLPGD